MIYFFRKCHDLMYQWFVNFYVSIVQTNFNLYHKRSYKKLEPFSCAINI